ncbi:MAG: ABC transporter [Pseudomonas sp.]|jgi:lipopolysaccharide transport system permease protein|uniref:ABC transporter permease n=1 Tax=Stutzerimonas sp. FeSN7 TaxID=3035479 RepID=UPI000C6AB328|nr:ABC transporter permease [Stutzerimonas sp. FeSN7]MAG64327.1 ABC transporter [Pseudomonadales bacterium]MAK87857.1 ABC transporter [Pseudomonas sp.]MDL2172699.1 ABC transporter permease [Stutzerimonas sp. FeSN7]HCH77364.1 ABC transporter [Pseudomonas sp.]|tara:strand:+ start:989 stop:1783 length:795 start_codon:yes stop_codon:yes gene_type:complete
MLALLKSLWAYRGFIVSSIRNEFVSRFARSRLGGLWMIIHPLAQVAIYALVLSNVLAARLPGIESKYGYAQYLLAGILAWSLFSEIVTRCLTLFIEQGSLMKKMRFPRITLPVIVMGSSLLNNLLLLLALLLVFALLGQLPHVQMLWLAPLTLACMVIALGIGLILGILNVFVRDIGQVVPILLQMWFWFTPIIYPVNIIPEAYRGALAFNPMFPIVNAYHEVLVYGRAPDGQHVLLLCLVGLLLMGLGLFMFRRAAPEMVDVL